MTFNPIIGGLSKFLQFSAAEWRIETEWMDIDQNYLRTGTVMGSRASYEH